MERKQDSPRGPCGLMSVRPALLMAGVLATGMLATAGPASAARADGCYTGCCYSVCGYGGYTGFSGYTGYPAYPAYPAYPGYPAHHAPVSGGVLPGRAGFQPFLGETSSVALSVQPTSGEEGTEFTWTATVTCGVLDEVTGLTTDEPVTSGTVTFDVAGHGYYAETVPITNGAATLTMTPPAAGFYTGMAHYNADGTTADGTACDIYASSNYSSITVTHAAPPGPPVVNVHVHVKVVNQFRFGRHGHHMHAPSAPAVPPSRVVPVTG